MTVRRVHLRLQEARRRWGDNAYARLAAFWRGGVRSDEEAAVLRLFCALVDWEAADGTPLTTLLARLPSEMADGIRRELGVILAGTTGLAEAER
jgi:hypothetical protein